jgi:hypothetical protein
MRCRERLGEVIPGAGSEGLDATGDAGVAGHHHDNGVFVCFESCLQDLETRDLGHVKVNEDDVEFTPPDRLQRFLTPSDEGHIVAIHLQHARAALPQGPLVVDDEHSDAGFDFAGYGEGIAGTTLSNGRDLPFCLGKGADHSFDSRGSPRWAVG